MPELIEHKTIRNGFRCLLTVCSVSLMVSACGGSGGGDGPEVQPEGNRVLNFAGLSVYGLSAGDTPEQVFTPWLASVNSFRSASVLDSGTVSVGTLQYGSDYSVQTEIDWRLSQRVPETCEIESDQGSSGGDGSSPPYVSAGSSVVINSPSGPWLQLDASNETGRYRSDRPGPFPAGASLSIPGNVFPSVSALRITEPQAPVRTSPAAGSNVGTETSYGWSTEGSNQSTAIVVDFLEYDAAGVFLGFPVYCFTSDNGTFVLPRDAAAALEATTAGHSIQVRYTRAARRIDYVDGIIVFQSTRVAE